MKLVKLRDIDLVYSNIPFEDYPEWDSSTTYNKGDRVILTSEKPVKIFESLVDNNANNYPPDTCWNELESNYPEWDRKASYSVGDRVKVSYEKDGITPLDIPQAFEAVSSNSGVYPPEDDETNWISLDKWKDLGATNRWRMFDGKVSTQTVNSDVIEVVVDFSYCDSFALFNLYADSISWKLYDGNYQSGKLIKSGQITNLQEEVKDWYEYFYSEIILKQDVFVDNLPALSNSQLKLAISPAGDSAKCGMMVIGRSKELGNTLLGGRLGILDFSVKEVDSEGNANLQQREYVKVIECDIWLPTKWIDIVRKELANVRAKPCVFVFNEEGLDFESFIVYGFYRSFDIYFSTPSYSRCSIQVEGLI